MDLDETPTNKPPPRRRLKGFGFTAAIIVILVLVIFFGFNAYYLAKNRSAMRPTPPPDASSSR